MFAALGQAGPPELSGFARANGIGVGGTVRNGDSA